MPLQSNTEFSYSLYSKQISGSFYFQSIYLSVGVIQGGSGAVIIDATTYEPKKFISGGTVAAQLQYAYQDGTEATLTTEFLLLRALTNGDLVAERVSYPTYNIISSRVIGTDCKYFRAIRVGRVIKIFVVSTDTLGSATEIRLDYNAEGQVTKVSNHQLSKNLNSVSVSSRTDSSIYLLGSSTGIEYSEMADPKHKQIN